MLVNRNDCERKDTRREREMEREEGGINASYTR